MLNQGWCLCGGQAVWRCRRNPDADSAAGDAGRGNRGTALIFGAVVKIITTPLYIARREVDWKTLGFLLATGLPGVLAGSLLLRGVRSSVLTVILGATIVSIALLNLSSFFERDAA
jgi:uncharacterized membrane protein YfcA